MTTFALDRLFQDSLAVGLERNGLAAAVKATTTAYPPELRREISAILAEVIAEGTQNDGIELDEADGTTVAPEQFHSAILRMRSANKIQKITFLRIKDAALETIVPLMSMALTAWAGDVKALVAGLQSVTMLWKNLVTLKRETDSCAIDVYEALVAEHTAKRTAKGGSPTTNEIVNRLSTRPLAEVAAGLKRLLDLKLIEISHWGGPEGDMSIDGNAWKVRL
jgi:hypothetical protein